MKNVLSIVLISAALFFGCNKEENKDNNTMPQQNSTSVSEDKNAMDSSLIQEAGVDIASLDLNKDGKVYQCPMDYEVIADHNASCPMCKMDLEEVSVSDAAKNLK